MAENILWGITSHQSSIMIIKALHNLPFVQGINHWLVDSLHKGPVMEKVCPYHGFILWCLQYIPRNMHTVFALLCFVVVIHWLIFPYPSGLLHWHCGNLTIAPVPAKQPWWIWINASCEFIMNDCITTRNMHTFFALLCFVVVIHWLIFPYPSGLLHWHCGNLTIAPVPAKQPWWIWINASCEVIMNDCITTTKQSTTKPCAYFLGYTVWTSPMLHICSLSCLPLLLVVRPGPPSPVTSPRGLVTERPSTYWEGYNRGAQVDDIVAQSNHWWVNAKDTSALELHLFCTDQRQLHN